MVEAAHASLRGSEAGAARSHTEKPQRIASARLPRSQCFSSKGGVSAQIRVQALVSALPQSISSQKSGEKAPVGALRRAAGLDGGSFLRFGRRRNGGRLS